MRNLREEYKKDVKKDTFSSEELNVMIKHVKEKEMLQKGLHEERVTISLPKKTNTKRIVTFAASILIVCLVSIGMLTQWNTGRGNQSIPGKDTINVTEEKHEEGQENENTSSAVSFDAVLIKKESNGGYILTLDKSQSFGKGEIVSVGYKKGWNADIEEGDLVTVFFDGMVRESYPAQISASKILEKKKPEERYIYPLETYSTTYYYGRESSNCSFEDARERAYTSDLVIIEDRNITKDSVEKFESFISYTEEGIPMYLPVIYIDTMLQSVRVGQYIAIGNEIRYDEYDWWDTKTNHNESGTYQNVKSKKIGRKTYYYIGKEPSEEELVQYEKGTKYDVKFHFMGVK